MRLSSPKLQLTPPEPRWFQNDGGPVKYVRDYAWRLTRRNDDGGPGPKISQAKLARRAGLTEASLSRFLDGRGGFRLEQFGHLVATLGLQIAFHADSKHKARAQKLYAELNGNATACACLHQFVHKLLKQAVAFWLRQGCSVSSLAGRIGVSPQFLLNFSGDHDAPDPCLDTLDIVLTYYHITFIPPEPDPDGDPVSDDGIDYGESQERGDAPDLLFGHTGNFYFGEYISSIIINVKKRGHRPEPHLEDIAQEVIRLVLDEGRAHCHVPDGFYMINICNYYVIICIYDFRGNFDPAEYSTAAGPDWFDVPEVSCKSIQYVRVECLSRQAVERAIRVLLGDTERRSDVRHRECHRPAQRHKTEDSSPLSRLYRFLSNQKNCN